MKIHGSAPITITEKGITFKRYVSMTPKDAKFFGLRYRTRYVLHRNLRDRLDLHGKPYKPSVFIYLEVNN